LSDVYAALTIAEVEVTIPVVVGQMELDLVIANLSKCSGNEEVGRVDHSLTHYW
jgi:hypothetical protein